VSDAAERNRLFNAVETFPCIKKKAEWAVRWIHDKRSSFLTRLLGFACVEGIFFSGAFCAIYWIKKRGLLPGLILVVVILIVVILIVVIVIVVIVIVVILIVVIHASTSTLEKITHWRCRHIVVG
jgi:hypothetical protein